MPASNIGETARALASLSDPAGEIGKMGIPVVRRSEMIAVPLLESSIRTAVVSFHFRVLIFDLGAAFDVFHAVHRAIEHPDARVVADHRSRRRTSPKIVGLLFL